MRVETRGTQRLRMEMSDREMRVEMRQTQREVKVVMRAGRGGRGELDQWCCKLFPIMLIFIRREQREGWRQWMFGWGTRRKERDLKREKARDLKRQRKTDRQTDRKTPRKI